MKPFQIPKQLKTMGSAQKIPVQRKQNGNESESPMERRQMQMTRGRDLFGGGAMSEPRVLRATKRQVLSTLNTNNSASWSQSQHDTPSTPGGSSDANNDSFPSSFSIQDIESLLHEKMKGKSKFDHRGKCEQMMQYIKKLRACIRWLQEMEGIYMDEKEKSQNDLLKAKNEHDEIEDELKKKVEELEMTIVRSKQSCCSFQENLRKTEAEKEAVTFILQKEIEARQAAEKTNVLLTKEIEKCSREVSSINQQVDSLHDINTGLQEYNTSLQIYNSKLQSDVAIAAETISQIQKEKSSLMETLSSLRGRAVALQENLDGAKASLQDGVNQKKFLMEEIEQLRGEIQCSTDVRCQQVAQVETLKTDILKYKECLSKSAAEYEQLAKKTKTLEESFHSQGEQIRTLCGQLEVTNHKLQISETSALQLQRKDSEQKRKIKELQRSLAESELQNFQGELLRKNLHNTILELKGNIRVFCRVRPLFSEEEFKGMEPSVVQYPMSAELVGRGIDLIYGPGKKYSFTFDKVFGPDAGQEEVFVEISQLVQSALDGYKVCIFAYGQTGSGKTYTMLGKPDVAEQKGIIPRSLEQIFKASETLALQGWTFRMQASMLEIYTETIRDLLVVNKSGNVDGTRAEIGTPVKNYTIKHDQNGNTIVSELTVVDVSKWKEVSSLLHRAAHSRSVGRTSMNEQSSRSHCVFTLRISGVNESTEQQVEGVLNLVDLAGSERLSRSGSTGERLKETQAINKSLACLGDVILAIANREPHVPYRNSKLTYLLQPCLGGDSKTLMFANISPNAKSLNESLCSLRFAAKVNACEIGVPRRHTRIRATDSWLSHK